MGAFTKKKEVSPPSSKKGRQARTFASRPDTVNKAGGVAFSKDDQLKLVSILFTSFVEDQFYRKADTTLAELKALVAKVDLKFAAKAAIYARTEFGMRSITHATAACIAHHARGLGLDWIKQFVNKVVYRVDDAAEILAAYLAMFPDTKKKRASIPNGLKKGLALSLRKFDAYQIAKYRGEKDSVKLVDLFNLVHPKPSEKQQQVFKDLIENKLVSTGTWEVELSEAGKAENKGEAKKNVWKRLLSENKLPYFALLRNLRNILETEDEEIVDSAIAKLTDEKVIQKSLVLPFRYITAQKEIDRLPDGSKLKRKISNAIDKAVGLSLSNVPAIKGETLIAMDDSGSMTSALSKSMKGTYAVDVACLFTAVLAKKNDCDVLLFNSTARYVPLNTRDSVTTINEGLRKQVCRGGTSFESIFRTANKKYDNVIILTDEQAWRGNTMGSFEQYCKTHKCFPNLFCFDLAGYGTMQFPKEGVFSLAGFSEKALTFISMLQEDRNAMITAVEAVEL